jgi:uncharacterized protein YcfL
VYKFGGYMKKILLIYLLVLGFLLSGCSYQEKRQEKIKQSRFIEIERFDANFEDYVAINEFVIIQDKTTGVKYLVIQNDGGKMGITEYIEK